jgi:EVE domain
VGSRGGAFLGKGIIMKPDAETSYWITPVKVRENESAEHIIQTLVGNEKKYALGSKVLVKRKIKEGDWICFYSSMKGIVAHAQVTSNPTETPDQAIFNEYSWVFNLENTRLYLDRPIAISSDIRRNMDAFKKKRPGAHWAWIVQTTRRLTKHDFDVLTRQQV